MEIVDDSVSLTTDVIRPKCVSIITCNTNNDNIMTSIYFYDCQLQKELLIVSNHIP